MEVSVVIKLHPKFGLENVSETPDVFDSGPGLNIEYIFTCFT